MQLKWGWRDETNTSDARKRVVEQFVLHVRFLQSLEKWHDQSQAPQLHDCSKMSATWLCMPHDYEPWF